jgi:ornithine cyclodeaminase/alanine dehydrogenase-like protein (mu-crystallin family)
VIVLMDGEDGRPLAVMDSMEVTLRRTAAATAVAAKHLARSDARVATICGCGLQGRAQLKALARVLPLERAFAFDTDPSVARTYAEEMSRDLGIEVQAAADLARGLEESLVCVTSTPSREPFLLKKQVRPGTFVAAVGADSPDKQELDPELLAGSRVVADVLDQCASIGELHHALAAGVMAKSDVHGELADLIAGRKPGRTSNEQITIFDSTGTALEDVAAAASVYEKALERGAGLRLDLGGKA